MNVETKLQEEFVLARAFVECTHASDLAWLRSRSTLVENFDDFFEEYVYVVVASGFRGATAARLAPLLVACRGDYERMLTVFKNRAKCRAIADVWAMRDRWATLRASFVNVDSLERLPRIGPTVKWHLARNIGLYSGVKPDLHLTRLAAEHGSNDVQALVTDLADANGLSRGEADFILWVWLSHKRGVANDNCCFGKQRLR